jgi:hypothetical protein
MIRLAAKSWMINSRLDRNAMRSLYGEEAT